MESISPTVVKRFRGRTDVKNMQLIECKREFVLVQQYPSTVIPGWNKPGSPCMTNAVVKQRLTGPRYNTVLPQSIKIVPTREISSLANIKRLRIKSKDGRDLGEMNVQFLSQKDNTLHGKTIAVTKPGFVNKLSKPVKISIKPSDTNGRVLSISPMDRKEPESAKLVAVVPKPAPSSPTNDSERKCNAALQKLQPTIKSKPVKQCIMCESNNLPQRKVTGQLSGEPLKAQPLTNGMIKCVKVTKELPVPVSVVSNKSLWTYEQRGNEKREKFIIRQKQSVSKPVVEKKESVNAKWYEQIARSKFPIVKCERLCVPVDKDAPMKRTIEKLSEAGDRQTGQNDNKRVKTENQSVGRNDIGQCKLSKVLKESAIRSDTKPVASERTFISQKTPALPTTEKTVHRKPESLLRAGVWSVEPRHAAPVSIKVEDTSILLEELIIPTPTDMRNDITQDAAKDVQSNQTNQESNVEPQAQEKLSDSLSIIQKALSSVTDEELRNKALQALADCGIGIERRVPIPPPEQLRSVHDTQTQTEIFSLLEKENFVLVRKDQPSVQRMKQPETPLPEPPMNLGAQSEKNGNNLTASDNLMLGSTTPFLAPNNTVNLFGDGLSIEDLDKMVDNMLNENTSTNRVREVLSKPCSKQERIMLQMKRDFETRRQWDEDGLLNIHKAVMNCHAAAVERFLMVLKACKDSVDLETATGETSLELAIRYEAPAAIVKMLLEAGAQPVSPKPVHDSAVLLASKASSQLLPELLKYVKEPKLLDQINSEGYAAIHYCVLNNNLANVSALIEAGAHVDLRDKRSGRTAIFHAIEKSYNAVAQRLLDAGAAMHLPNFAGQTVLMFAEETTNVCLRTALNKHLNTGHENRDTLLSF